MADDARKGRREKKYMARTDAGQLLPDTGQAQTRSVATRKDLWASQ